MRKPDTLTEKYNSMTDSLSDQIVNDRGKTKLKRIIYIGILQLQMYVSILCLCDSVTV